MSTEHRTLYRRGPAVRRSVALAALSMLLPGAGHLVAGRRRTGAVTVLGFLVLAGTVGAFAATRSKGDLLVYSVRPTWLLVIMIGTIALAVSWVLSIIGAFAVARPSYMTPAQRAGSGLVVLVLCLTVAAPLARAAQYAYIQRDLVVSRFGSAEDNPLAGQTRINLLLVGGDAGPDRAGVRTDSMTVASIDLATGDTVLLSLPRNLYRAPFPVSSALHSRFPTGFSGKPVGEYILNAVWAYGEGHPTLVPPGGGTPGAGALLASVETILDLEVNFWILVNLSGFRQMVDAVGGVTIRVDERIPIGGGSGPVTGWIEPGLQELSGYQALWYARSRASADDYARMARQRCVFGALARQVDPSTMLTRFPQIAGATKELIDTNLSQRMLEALARVAGNAQSAEITSVQFVPPLIDTLDPDYSLIRTTAHEAIAASKRRAAEKAARSHGAASAGTQPRDQGSGLGGSGSSITGAESLDAVCRFD